MHRVLVGIVVALALATTAAMALLASRPALSEDDTAPAQLVDGTILEVTPLPNDPAAPEAQFLPPGAREVDLRVSLDATGEEVLLESVVDGTGSTYRAGQRVRLEPAGDGAETIYSVVDFRRDRPLAILAALFVIAVVAFGRFQGVRALVGLALSAVVVAAFLVPAILAGRDPVVVALTSASAIMILTLYLTHGPSEKTTAAVVGTALTLLLTGGLALLFIRLADLTGLSSEEAVFANVAAGGLSLRGLLLAGIILGALGVLDDVTVSQSSLVFELARADARASFSTLVRRGLRVGRDHVSATVNTLFLAYAGASLPLLILFATGVDPVTTVLTSEIVAIEVVRTLVGSLGLIAAVPLTTAMAAALAIGEREGEVEQLPALRLPERRPMPVAVGQHDPGATARGMAEPRPGRQHLRPVEPPEPQPYEFPPERYELPAAWQVPPGHPAEPGEAVEPASEPPTEASEAVEPAATAPAAWRVPPGRPAEPPEAPPREPDEGRDLPDEEPLPSRRARAAQQAQQPVAPGRLRRRARPASGRAPEQAQGPTGGQLELPRPPAEEQPDPAEPRRRRGRGGDEQEPPRPRRLGRGQRRTAAQAEQEQLEDWFRQLRNPYGRQDGE